MGCLWAAKIWQHAKASAELNDVAQPVTLLLRDEAALTHYQRTGGILLHYKGVETVMPVRASTINNASIQIDNLLLCTKAQDALQALENVKHLLHTNSNVFLIQNGIKAQHEILARFPTLQLYCMSTSHGAYLLNDYNVVHAGLGDTFLGTLNPQCVLPTEQSSQLLDSLPSDAMNIVWDLDITARLWTKFAINCAINALTVIYNCRNGELLTLPAAIAELPQLCGEIESILHTVADCQQPMALLEKVEAVLRATALNYSSTLQDVRKGRPTEIAYFNGYLRELAQQANRACPINDEVLRRFHTKTQDTSD